MGRKDEAILCYYQTIKINPNFCHAYINKGNVLKDLGRFEEAIVCYDQAIRIDSNIASAHFNKGNILKAMH